MHASRRLMSAGLTAAALVALGCGEENPRLLPEQQAQALLATVDDMRAAIDEEDCAAALGRVQAARVQVDALSPRVAQRLRQRLDEGLDYIEGRIPEDCASPEPTVTPVPTPTPAETPAPTPSPSPTVTPDVQPPEGTGVPENGNGNGNGGGNGNGNGNGQQGERGAAEGVNDG